MYPPTPSLYGEERKKIALIIISEWVADSQCSCYSSLPFSSYYFKWLCPGYKVFQQLYSEMVLLDRYLVMLPGNVPDLYNGRAVFTSDPSKEKMF